MRGSGHERKPRRIAIDFDRKVAKETPPDIWVE